MKHSTGTPTKAEQKRMDKLSHDDLLNECNKLFLYDKESGLVTRKIEIYGGYGAKLSNVKCKIGAVVGSKARGYLYVSIKRKTYLLHRIIWLMVTGAFPKNHIDHINGNKSDNRWCNIREATNYENSCNTKTRSDNKVGYKGVCVQPKSKKNPFVAQIQVNKSKIYLGCFPTAELAYEAYVEASVKMHGEFSRVK